MMIRMCSWPGFRPALNGHHPTSRPCTRRLQIGWDHPVPKPGLPNHNHRCQSRRHPRDSSQRAVLLLHCKQCCSIMPTPDASRRHAALSLSQASRDPQPSTQLKLCNPAAAIRLHELKLLKRPLTPAVFPWKPWSICSLLLYGSHQHRRRPSPFSRKRVNGFDHANVFFTSFALP